TYTVAVARSRCEYRRRAGGHVWLDETFNAPARGRHGSRHLCPSTLRAFRAASENRRRAHKLPCICAHRVRLVNSSCAAWDLGFHDGHGARNLGRVSPCVDRRISSSHGLLDRTTCPAGILRYAPSLQPSIDVLGFDTTCSGM